MVEESIKNFISKFDKSFCEYVLYALKNDYKWIEIDFTNEYEIIGENEHKFRISYFPRYHYVNPIESRENILSQIYNIDKEYLNSLGITKELTPEEVYFKLNRSLEKVEKVE